MSDSSSVSSSLVKDEFYLCVNDMPFGQGYQDFDKAFDVFRAIQDNPDLTDISGEFSIVKINVVKYNV